MKSYAAYIAVWTLQGALLSVSLPSFAADKLQPFLDRHCLDCHGDDAHQAGMRLTDLSTDLEDPYSFRAWVTVFERVEKGEMPPRDAEQPAEAERNEFLKMLGSALNAADQKAIVDHGRQNVRRMNRAEYEHTLRDLLHLPLLQVKDMLPEDGQQAGFDKVGGALDFSPVLISKYMATADVALRMALREDSKNPETIIWREPASRQDTVRGAIAIHCAVPLKGRELASGLTTSIVGNPENNLGNVYRAAHFNGDADSVALLTGVIGAHQPQGLQPDRFKPPVSGWYRVKFSAWGLRWMRTQAQAAKRGLVRRFSTFDKPYFKNRDGKWEFTRLADEKLSSEWMENIEFYGDAEVTQIVRASIRGKPISYFDVPSLKPTVQEFNVWLNPGERVSFHAMTLPAIGASNSGTSEGVRDYEGPAVAFDWFEVEGPLADQGPSSNYPRLLESIRTEADPRILLTHFAEVAFRRPVLAEDIERYVDIVEGQLKNGAGFQTAIAAGYKAILCSPDFLMLGLEGDDYALAARMSYFLWNGPPDAELIGLAAKGELSLPETRRKQVRRMLADSRSNRFIEHFLDEWIELKKIDFTTPDPALYPEFDPWLQDSMLTETRNSFRRMLDQDLGVRCFIQDDTVSINQRLAELYGLRGINGSTFRQVKLPSGSPRGGLLTQASVLKVTANGTATSPVLRGVWVMERILGIPRQPPPPNVPAIEPDATGAVTIREMIEKHRADPACASCHARMDPPGLALENFDAIGGWRDRYRLAGKPKKVRVGKGKEAKMILEPTIEVVSDSALRRNRVQMRLGPSVDASGELVDGRRFTDIYELRALLLADEDALARNVIRQLMTYATGRPMRFSDRDEIDAIVSKTKVAQHGLHTVIEYVVASPLFAN
jgi:hypothetical protein